MDKAENLKGKVHFGVITIKSEEYQAFLEHLPKTSIVDGKNERRYRVAQLGCSDGSEVTVAVTRCLEQGNVEAQKVASDLVQDLAPQWVFVVGIAGGVPSLDFSLGDVVVSSRVYDLTLESSKPGGEREYSIKGDALHPLARRIVQDIPGMLASELVDWHSKVGWDRPIVDLVGLDSHLRGDDEWNSSVKGSLIKHFSTNRFPLVLPGAIASSDRLVKDPEITAGWKRVARHIMAVEMELAGVCRTLGELPVLGIRGISDVVGFKRDEVWTAYACKTAAAFAVALIRSGLMPLKQSELGVSASLAYMNLNDIRFELNQTFDDTELDSFCLDNFPMVFDKFSRGMRKDEKITLLLDCCRRVPERYQKLLTKLAGYQNFDPSLLPKLLREITLFNPFIYGRPVVGEEFLNRDAELRAIFNRLRNGESTAISGEPHIGKTSLLLKLANQTTQQTYLGDEFQHLTVNLMDMHPIGNDYTPALFWKEALEPLDIKSGIVALQYSAETNYSRRLLEQLFKYLDGVGHRLVLLLDEFERLLNHPNFQDPAFFALLRSLTSCTGGLALVIASRYSVAEMNEMGRSLLSVGSPFFNIMIDMRLSSFDDKTVDTLLGQVGDVFSSNDRRFIRLVAGDNPFLIQAMAGALAETVGQDRCIRAAELFYKRINFHFDDLWQMLNDRVRSAIVVLGLIELIECTLGHPLSGQDIESMDAFVFEVQKLAGRGLPEQWKTKAKAFIWWVRDVVLLESRQVIAYDKWVTNKGYRYLLTQQQWNQLINMACDVIDWSVCNVQMLARNLFREVVRREEQNDSTR